MQRLTSYAAACLLLLFTACKKDISVQDDSINANAIASDALSPLSCHSTEFISDHPVVGGKVPPFKFTKTLYADTRVKTIDMTSRVFPIHQFYQSHSVQLKGQFTYGPNRAYLKGTSETFAHYKYPDGTVKKSIAKKNINLKFYFTPEGYCRKITDLNRSQGPAENQEPIILDIAFTSPQIIAIIGVLESPEVEAGVLYYPRYDQYGNILTFDRPYNRWASFLTYTYDYSKPRGTKNYSFIPSQNWISQEYSLLEVMQWLPQSNHQRKSVSASFYPYTTPTYPFNTGQKIVQSQVYKNYQFDAKGNQTSVTYGDNIPQRTTWFCK